MHGALRGTKAKTLSNDDQVQTGSMVNAGVLTRSASGGVELSAAARYSLLIDEAAPSQ